MIFSYFNLGVSGCRRKFYAKQFVVPASSCQVIDSLLDRSDRLPLQDGSALNFTSLGRGQEIAGACAKYKYVTTETKTDKYDFLITESFYISKLQGPRACTAVIASQQTVNEDRAVANRLFNKNLNGLAEKLKIAGNVIFEPRNDVMIFDSKHDLEIWCDQIN